MNNTIERVCKEAGAAGQVGTVAHLYAFCLASSTRNNVSAVKSLERSIRSDILAHMTPEQVMPNSVNAKLPICSFKYNDFSRAFEEWKRAKHEIPVNIYDAMLSWMLTRSESADQTEELVRKLCRSAGITAITFQSIGDDSQASNNFGPGVLVNEHWVGQNSAHQILGREDDLKTHIESLALAVVRGRHYLLDGHPGVGKTSFLKTLLLRAHAAWSISHERALRSARFLLCSSDDFTGTEEESRKKIEDLYSLIRERPEIVPVFDQFEHIMNPVLSLHSSFVSTFGGLVQSVGRPCVFVMRTESTNHEMLRGIPRHALHELPIAPTSQIVKEKLPLYLNAGGASFTLLEDEDQFCQELTSLASSRYPGHFRPRICLELAEGAVNRAVHRQLRNEEPLGQVTLRDLKEHVAQERQISIELLGKDPSAYYATLSEKLKADVIGQEHAIDTICSVLARQASMPPRRTPRGRFLFVGPPGVGKTQLGRQLAIRLGYGEEGFFIVNMSEYSSDGARTRFLGADPGYVGFGATQTIFDKVRSRPSCVVVLDEIDRSHPSIQDILLGILEGEGKDALGSSVQFSHVIFIMTTNQGQEQVVTAYEAAMRSELATCDGFPTQYLFEHLSGGLSTEESERAEGEVARLRDARQNLIQSFCKEDTLRDLMLKGAVDETESEMIRFVDDAIDTCRRTFNIEKDARVVGESETSADAIEAFIRLKRTRENLEQVHAKESLDRALLDRIDFIVPFFPIKEPPLLARILNLKLNDFGWNACPPAIRCEILGEALAQQESIRPLERLIIKRMAHGALQAE